MKERNLRWTVISLVVICVVLLAGLGVATTYYAMTLHSRDATIELLNKQILDKNDRIASLSTQVDDYLAMLNLEKQEIWLRNTTGVGAGYLSVAEDLSYAGYVLVRLYESNSTDTAARVIWSYKDIQYNNTVMIGSNGAAVFPVMPTHVEVRVGNFAHPELVLATTVDIIYYY